MNHIFKGTLLAACLAALPLASAAQGLSNSRIADGSSHAFAVTYGSYANQGDADAVMAYVKRSKIPSFSEPTVINGRPAWRVRLGPFSTWQQAEDAKAKGLTLRSDVKAQIITLDSTVSPAAQPAVMKATPVELFQAYSENEVRADQKYKRKRMLVTGQIRSIRSGVGDQPLVILAGGGRFEDVYARDIPAAQAVQLNRDQVVTLLCEGSGTIASTPQLKGCIVYSL
ncbi:MULTISPECIES: SPOR domain-containing protein [Stenotrophomonas]|uniref:SPOR domain-containing protein n=1 Tax=Stenotrophomonas maltophilia TaxID=40324 RepID=UPI0015A72B8B|nr:MULTISPECIES: SPOR domain-containing protein [Stenotrophomonas]